MWRAGARWGARRPRRRRSGEASEAGAGPLRAGCLAAGPAGWGRAQTSVVEVQGRNAEPAGAMRPGAATEDTEARTGPARWEETAPVSPDREIDW